MTELRHFCVACGDRCSRKSVTDRPGWYCRTCYNELEMGVICNQNIAMSGGGRGVSDPDMGSYRTIAVRALEDNHD